MQPDAGDAARLWDMVSAAREVVEFVDGRTLRRAVERSIEIVGEAARGVSRFQAAHPQVPWNPIIVQRHRLAHEYGLIREQLIWEVRRCTSRR